MHTMVEHRNPFKTGWRSRVSFRCIDGGQGLGNGWLVQISHRGMLYHLVPDGIWLACTIIPHPDLHSALAAVVNADPPVHDDEICLY